MLLVVKLIRCRQLCEITSSHNFVPVGSLLTSRHLRYVTASV